jgi:hypothetical protein
MRKVFFTLSLGVLCSAFALAQDTATTGQPATPTDSSSSPSSVQGCLNGSNGNYTLTQDGTGTTYKLMGYESQLKKHVGHEVAITGQASGNAATGDSAAGQGQAQPPSDNSNGNAIQVTNVKMISKQCSAGGMNSPQSQ